MKYSILLWMVMLTSCNHLLEENTFEEYALKDCFGKSKNLLLPKGWLRDKSHYNGHGYLQLIQYPDSSYIMINCAHTTEIQPSKLLQPGFHSRIEVIDGISILYSNVPTRNKPEFDRSFELMKK